MKSLTSRFVHVTTVVHFEYWILANERKQSKLKRTRTTYTSTQLMQLEAEFQSGRYLCRSRRIQISAALNLTEKQIKIWFQNRRMKYKKDKCDTQSLMSTDQTDLAGCSRNTPTCYARHNFNTVMSDQSRTCPSDMAQSLLQNTLLANYGIVDQQQQLKQQNCLVQRMQVPYNTSPDCASCSHQQCFNMHQQPTSDHIASDHSEPQMNNSLLQQRWKYEGVQNNSNGNSQAQSDHIDADVAFNANNISDQIMSTFMSEKPENYNVNNASSLRPFSSWSNDLDWTWINWIKKQIPHWASFAFQAELKRTGLKFCKRMYNMKDILVQNRICTMLLINLKTYTIFIEHSMYVYFYVLLYSKRFYLYGYFLTHIYI